MNFKTLIIILLTALATSIVSLLFFVLGGGLEWMGHGIGGMGGMTQMTLLLALIVLPLVVVTILLGYSVVFPELNKNKPETKPSSAPVVKKGESAIDAVLRVLDENERKVVETLVAEGGTMLQKDIRWKTGLSRVKLHRILYRLAERGIVSAEKHFNTNKITLADWLRAEHEKT